MFFQKPLPLKPAVYSLAIACIPLSALPLTAQAATVNGAPVKSSAMKAKQTLHKTPASSKYSTKLEELEVVAHPLSAEGLSQAATVLTGAELSRKLQGSIGATVAQEPGIHSASFGQAVGRPVIHGLGGARVRIMEDRIDTMDVSVTSSDHAATVEPFIADRVEVLKGASTLLYGSGAIGGVVDIHTGRIPHSVPEKLISGRAEVRYDDNADTQTGAFRLDGGSGNFAWHVDGFHRDANNYEIPGFAESSRLHALEEAEAEEHGEEHEEEHQRGELEGSDLNTKGGAFGVSYAGESSFLGLAVSRLESRYGLPGEHAHEEEEEDHDHAPGEEHHEEEEGNAILDMEQTRIDIEGGIDKPFNGIASINVRLGINDYEHTEFEPSGEAGTKFENEAWETRVEWVHEAIMGWDGAFGFQYQDREFSAAGEEAFIAPVDTESLGIFWVGQYSLESFDLEAGVRVESVEHDSSDASLRDTDFTNTSTALGAVIPLTDTWTLSVHGDYSTRAPVGEELYSNGAHLAESIFVIGDDRLDEEQALNVSVTLDYSSDRWSMAATLYRTDFSDYIFRNNTGTEADGLPVFQYTQEDAEFQGLDLEVEYLAAQWDEGQLTLSAMYDMVNAELDISGNDNVPRTPPSRFGAGIESQWGVITARAEYTRVQEQDDVADLELVTSAYEDLRAYVGADFEWNATQMTVFLQGRNLTDDEQRNHTSFIKDIAPAPGRTVEAGVRVSF